MSSPTMRAADFLVKTLENEGVTHIFGLAGEENLDLLDALKNSSIRFVPTRHEQSAGFMAATYGRLTGKAGVCLATLGPGATNLVTPAAYAHLGGMPIVMITGQKPIKTNKQGHFQIVNTIRVLNPLTKYSRQITDTTLIAPYVREAFRVAEEERPGAVHLELPKDIATEEVTAEPFVVQKVRRPIAEERAIQWAVEMIEAAKHPLILIGAGANRKRTSRVLKEFIDATGIPFFNTQMGKGVIDERHPLYLGTAAVSDNDFLHLAIKKADLIINIGHDVAEKPPFIMHRNGTKVIHVNFYSAKVDNVYFPQLEVISDIANAVWQMKEKVTKQPHWDFTYFMKIKGYLEAHIAEKEGDTHFPLIPQRVIADVRKTIPDDGIITLDNGMYKIWFARNFKAYGPNTLLLDNALATMGAGLPAAIAAKIVYPEKNVLAVCGDGGFMMNSQELETAVRLKLDLVILILNDNGFGMIKWEQSLKGFERFGLDFGNPDFVKLAESYGAYGYRVQKTDDLQTYITACLGKKGVHLIDVPIDYSENNRVFYDELKKVTATI